MTSTPLQRRRVVLVINDVRWFFSHRLALSERLRAFGAEVVVAAPQHPLSERVEAEGFRFEPVSLNRGFGGVRAELRGLFDLYRLYRSLRPDIVHHVTVKPVLFGSLAARAARVPAVINLVAGMGSLFMAGGVTGRLRRYALTWAYRVALGGRNRWLIVQNSEDRDLFLRRKLAKEDRTCLIRGSGVDPAAFTPAPEPPTPIVAVLPARMILDKGVGDFVEAARILRARGRDYRFLLAGDVDPANPTSIAVGQLEGWEQEGVVEWLGHRSDMAEVFRNCHIVVLPSYREGLPKVLLEAGASERAVVTNDVPGCREVVVDGVNGLLVTARDSEALANALDRLAKSPAMRRAMGRAGREMVTERFSDAVILNQTTAVYVRALSSGGAR